MLHGPEPIAFTEGEWLRSLLNDDRRPNVLVVREGPSAATVAARVSSRSTVRVDSCVLPGGFHLPYDRPETFVLHDVSKLTIAQQIALHDWLNDLTARTQVVSITSVPLLPLVNDGQFLESLYYRLNVI